MKICIVKQPYVATLTWESTRFTTGRDLLNRCFFRASYLSLLIGLEGDIWVVEDGEFRSGSYDQWARDKAAMETLYAKSTAVPMESVPWGDYDVVISGDAIIPDSIIKEHPRTLWCYFPCEHTTWDFVESKKAPIGVYDLFLDFTLSSSWGVQTLPQTVSFPHTIHSDIMCELIKPINAPFVFLSGRMVRPHTGGQNLFASPPKNHIIESYQKKSGLPIKYPMPFNYGKTAALIALNLIPPSEQFLAGLGSCKYLLHVPTSPRDVGQILIEAAALNLIVISGSHEAYSIVCHPSCVVKPGDVEAGLRKIAEIESDELLQNHILAEQRAKLQFHFWDEPLFILEEALEMKRGPHNS